MLPTFAQQIINLVTKEDAFKLFVTPAHHPNIFDALSCLGPECTLMEVRTAVMHLFTQAIRQSIPNTFYHNEAQRMMTIIDGFFNDLQREYARNQAVQRPRDANDDIVDLYMESLKSFASELDEKILQEHIWYLER